MGRRDGAALPGTRPVVKEKGSMELKKAAPVVSDINVTPMVDVMLVVLIIFMVITPMLSKGVAVDMVKTRHPVKMQEADKEDAILIAITRDGKVFLSPGNVQMAPDQLPQKVKDLQTGSIGQDRLHPSGRTGAL